MEYDEGRIVFGSGPSTEEEDMTEEIRRRAYDIWEHEGCPEGMALEHWLRAKQDIQASHRPGA